MKPKVICKTGVDLFMTILLLLLMARQITGDVAHEWLGAGMFALWIGHHVLNMKWYGHIGKGKYTPFRRIQLAVNGFLLLAMMGSMISGVILSREVFRFLPVSGGIALARPLHILSAYWGFVLMALHLGLHWNVILGRIRKAAGPVSSSKVKMALRIAGGAVALYGIYGFVKNQFFDYLFLRSSFVFFDFEQPLFFFFTEYMAIMELFVFLAYYGEKGLGRIGSRRKQIS